MTCRERLAVERPDKISSDSPGGCYACPCTYGYLGRPEYCNDASNKAGDRCGECWDREIPEEGDIRKDDIPAIKDSGDRTLFDTGAVRDMREGKGRCDLMPLEVVAEWLKDDVLGCIAQFKIHGTITFLYGALNYFCATAYPNMHTSKIEACLEVAKHFEEGAKKYGESNWQKGIPVHCYIDSAVRHYLKWLRGDKDEPHDRAFVWNLMCCIWEVDYSPRAKEEAK